MCPFVSGYRRACSWLKLSMEKGVGNTEERPSELPGTKGLTRLLPSSGGFPGRVKERRSELPGTQGVTRLCLALEGFLGACSGLSFASEKTRPFCCCPSSRQRATSLPKVFPRVSFREHRSAVPCFVLNNKELFFCSPWLQFTITLGLVLFSEMDEDGSGPHPGNSIRSEAWTLEEAPTLMLLCSQSQVSGFQAWL